MLTIAHRMRAILWAAAVTAAFVPSLDFNLRNQSPNPAFERCSDCAAMRSALARRFWTFRVWAAWVRPQVIRLSGH